MAIALGRYEAYESLARPKDTAATLDWLAQQQDLGANAARARLLLGVHQLNTDLAAGVAAIEHVLAEPTAADLGEADREFARSMVATDLDEAIAHLRAAYTASPRHRQTLSQLGLFLLFAGDADAALEFARNYGLQYQDAIEPHLIAALAHACRGEFAIAERKLKAVETDQNRSLLRLWRTGFPLLELLEIGVLEIVRPQAVIFTSQASAAPSSTIPAPPEPFPIQNMAAKMKIAALLIQVGGLPKALGQHSLAGEEGSPRLRLHPWIRSHYRYDSVQSVLQLGYKLPDPASYRNHFKNKDSLPERFFWLCAAFEEDKVDVAWSMLQPAPLAEHRGLTGSLPSVLRLTHLYRLCANLASKSLGKPPVGQDAASMHASAVEDLEGALHLRGITQEELYAYLMMAVNGEFEHRWNWAERFLVRWQVLHGETWQWQLMRAEVLYARGLVDEARPYLESAAKLQPEHAWVASLRVRLGG